jgi:hypothetical protein
MASGSEDVPLSIRKANVRVRALDFARARTVARAGERALLEGLADTGDWAEGEVVILRRVDLRFRVKLDGSGDPVNLEREISEVVRRKIRETARGARHRSDADAAWFPSLASATAEHLAAISRGAGETWPFVMMDPKGGTWDEVLAFAEGRGARFLGDVLAELGRLVRPSVIGALTSDSRAESFLRHWQVAKRDRRFSWSLLPADIRAEIERALEELTAAWAARAGPAAHSDSRPAAALAALALVFAYWPPARDFGFEPGDLQDLLEHAAVPEPEARQETAAPRLLSRAGGLVAWAELFGAVGLNAELDAAYPNARERKAVNWAIAKALEHATVEPRDPLLLWWSGEVPGASIAPAQTLAEADTESLHALALGRAVRALDAVDLKIVAVGDLAFVVLPNGVVADALPRSLTDSELVPEVVRAFVRRTNRAPDSVEIAGGASSSDIDGIAEIDVPSLAERWRPAIRALASLARLELADQWRAAMGDLRGWPAVWIADDTIEIRRADAARARPTAWPDRFSIGKTTIIIV